MAAETSPTTRKTRHGMPNAYIGGRWNPKITVSIPNTTASQTLVMATSDQTTSHRMRNARYSTSAEMSSTFARVAPSTLTTKPLACLLYTSDAADERSSVDLGG